MTRRELEDKYFENGLRINSLVRLSEQTDPFSAKFERILSEIQRLRSENWNIWRRIFELSGAEIAERMQG